jgi:hypothetical protein
MTRSSGEAVDLFKMLANNFGGMVQEEDCVDTWEEFFPNFENRSELMDYLKN